MADKAPIIVIKRKKIIAGGAHGGAWKVAYADFVTAMMCFFLVMWLLGSDDEVKEAVSNYFNNPTSAWRPDLLNPNQVPLGEMSGSGEDVINGAKGEVPEDLIERPSKPNTEAPPGTVKVGEQSQGIASNIAPPAEVKIDEMKFSLEESNLFQGGTAQLSRLAPNYLAQLERLLRNFEGQLVIKGFTQPYETSAGDPYEFALARAVALADYFSARKWIDRDRVRAVVIDLRAESSSTAPTSNSSRSLQLTLSHDRPL